MRSRLAFAAVCCALSLFGAASHAHAAPSLRSPVGGGRVIVAFGGRYGAEARVHRGVDIAAGPGSAVRAPVAGTVTFAGRLPSGEGGASAVTITAADGARVTCSALADVGVAKGASVEAGALLGTSSAEGDPSSEVPHVHLSVREGDLYIDPAPLLETSAAKAAQQPHAPAASRAPAPVVAAPVVPAAAPTPHAPPAAVSAPVQTPAAASASAPRAAPAVAAAFRTCAWRVPLRHAAPPPAALPDLGPLTARLRELTLALGATMVAAALAVPVLRKRPFAAEPPAEAVPVRAKA